MPLPGNKIVTYKARETPSNESSSVLMNHRLHIAAQSQSGDDITWRSADFGIAQSTPRASSTLEAAFSHTTV